MYVLCKYSVLSLCSSYFFFQLLVDLKFKIFSINKTNNNKLEFIHSVLIYLLRFLSLTFELHKHII